MTDNSQCESRTTGGRRGWLFALALFFIAPMGGCATIPSPDDKAAMAAYCEANDPLEPLNRYFFEVTRFADFLILRPAAEIYRGIMPRFLRDRIRSFFGNLSEPVTLVHDVFQGEWERAGTTAARFSVNTTLGVGGLFNVAPYFDLARHSEDMGQTLAVYGVPEGPYLFLPFLGPSTIRDALGRVGDTLISVEVHPAQFFPSDNRAAILSGGGALSLLDGRARALGIVAQLESSSADYYAAVRQLYRQSRKNQINNGRIDISDLPDIPDEDFDLDFDDEEGEDDTPTGDN